jgi:diaminopimelate epimerase
MNGAGNDFIIVNNMELHYTEEQLSCFARVLCRRHLSIGADGFMAVDDPKMGGDYRMLFYNADGSVGEMCGNGARCICRYGYEHGLAGSIQHIETTAGMVEGTRVNQRDYRVLLNRLTKTELELPVNFEGKLYHCAYLELGAPGIPHVVLPIRDLAAHSFEELRPLAVYLRTYSAFPKGANVNFYECTGPDTVLEKTYERGVEDFTYACGTGTASVVAALTLMGKVSGKHVRVDMKGGTLYIDAERENGGIGNLYLTGPTNLVCTGEVTDEALAEEFPI